MSDAVLHGGLILLVLGLALTAVLTRDTFASITAFVVYGMLLGLAWVALGSIDVAMTEAALGSGITGALLLRAASCLRDKEAAAESRRPGIAERWVAGVVCTAVAGGLAAVVLMLPDPAPTLAPVAVESLPVTEVKNPVTGVLLAFRAWDTFLETVVLVLALVAVWGLAPDTLWGGRPGELHRPDPEGVLVFLARVLPPIGVLAGIHILWVGADAPGGKFQGGTILAAMWMLVMLAGLADAPPVTRRWLRAAVVLGPVTFLIAGLLGLVWASGLFAWPPGYSKPLILVIEAASTVSIGVTLCLLAIGPPARPATA
jgi:multisubunit Na+/H+ antiporter MnhB subunit